MEPSTEEHDTITTSVTDDIDYDNDTYVVVSDGYGDGGSVTDSSAVSFSNDENSSSSSSSSSQSDVSFSSDEDDNDDDEEEEEANDVFPTPPPPSSMANDTPVRNRGNTTPVSSRIPRWSSPSTNIHTVSPLGGGGGVGGVGGGISVRGGGTVSPLLTRPRSNPRVRTPMRNVSPFLGTVNRSTIGRADDDGEAVVAMEGRVRESQQQTTGGTRVVLGAGLSVGTVVREGAVAALRQRQSNRNRTTNASNTTTSNKQGPSHRKLRRWNNDRFHGIASDISHANPNRRGHTIARLFTEPDPNRSEHVWPGPNNNSNRYRKSCFRTLLRSGGGGGGGGKSRGSNGGNDDEDTYDGNNNDLRTGYDPDHIANVKERFLNGDVPRTNHNTPTNAALHRRKKREDETFSNGHRMIETKVGERLRNVVTRACASSLHSREILCAFEGVLVTNLSPSSLDKDGGLEQYLSVLEGVLCQPPLITKRKKSNQNSDTTRTTTVVRFLFDGTSDRAAFHRILLHGVGRFHGLDTASSTTAKGDRLVTVTGVCRGSEFRLLDFLGLDDIDDDDGLLVNDDGGKENVDGTKMENEEKNEKNEKKEQKMGTNESTKTWMASSAVVVS